MFKPGNATSPAEANKGLLITGGTSGSQKIVWDTGNDRFDITGNILFNSILYADGGIQRSTAALSIGGGSTTGITLVDAVTLTNGFANQTSGELSHPQQQLYNP